VPARWNDRDRGRTARGFRPAGSFGDASLKTGCRFRAADGDSLSFAGTHNSHGSEFALGANLCIRSGRLLRTASGGVVGTAFT